LAQIPRCPSRIETIIPTVNIAPAKGWPEGASPAPSAGLRSKPSRPASTTRVGFTFFQTVTFSSPKPMLHRGRRTNAASRAGCLELSRTGQVLAFRAPTVSPCCATPTATVSRRCERFFLQGLNSPIGMALVGHDLYVANTDAIMRFTYMDGETQIWALATKSPICPPALINHHWTKNLIANRDGSRLYVTVGFEQQCRRKRFGQRGRRAAILEVDPATGQTRVFASGLRNPNGMAWEPDTGVLWTVVNERNELGSDLVPDYLTSITEGGFYGWPFSYYGQRCSSQPAEPDLVAKAIIRLPAQPHDPPIFPTPSIVHAGKKSKLRNDALFTQ